MTGSMPRAAIVVTGSELLDGRSRDTSGVSLSAELSSLGVQVTSLLVVADVPTALEEAIRWSLEAHPDLLVVSGGLGATHDDLTSACLARALGVSLTEDPSALAMVEESVRRLAARRGRPFEELFSAARGQALLPAGASPVPPAGMAPGIAFRSGVTRIFALPGVPWEFTAMWEGIRGRLEQEAFFPPFVRRLVRIHGVGENQVAAVIDAHTHDLVETGVTVGGGEVTVHVRYARDAAAEAQAAALIGALETALPVFSSDGRTVDDLVATALLHDSSTLAVAESCTGGLLGARITERAGSSAYFLGGVISYANAVKTSLLGVPAGLLAQHGAVSESVAAAMAEGARRATGADYGLGVTGIAGPGGASADKPVGLVYVSCAGPRRTRAVRGVYPGDRASVRAFSATAALHLLREELAL